MKTNLAVVPPPAPKPLSSADLERLIAETREKLSAAVRAGDREAYRALCVDQNFNLDSLDAAREREAKEAEAVRERELAALRPEALEAVKAANPNAFAAKQMEKVRQAAALLCEVAHAIPGAIEGFNAAQARARELAGRAGIAYAGPIAITEQFVTNAVRAAWKVEVRRADVPDLAARYMPTLAVASVKLLDAPGADFRFPQGGA